MAEVRGRPVVPSQVNKGGGDGGGGSKKGMRRSEPEDENTAAAPAAGAGGGDEGNVGYSSNSNSESYRSNLRSGSGGGGGGGGGSDVADNSGSAISMDDLPTDPTKRKQELDRRESERKTNLLRKKCNPTKPAQIAVSKRGDPPAIKLRNLNVEQVTLSIKANKSKAQGQAMYYIDLLYKGKKGLTIQVDGKLLSTPMVSATYDTTNYAVELTDPVEQKIWSDLSKRFKKLMQEHAVKYDWPVAKNSIKKMLFVDFFLRGKIIDEDLRKEYDGKDIEDFPADMIDPATGKPIEFYPPKIKAQLVMSKTKEYQVETDVMDEHEVQMNAFDFKKGNRVRMAIRLGYAYYKAQTGASKPNEYGLPCKLAMIKRLDQNEDAEGGPLKRTRWADDDDATVGSSNPTTPAPAAAAPATAAAAPAAAASVPEGLLGAAGAALRDAVKEQTAAVAPNKDKKAEDKDKKESKQEPAKPPKTTDKK